MTQANVAAEDLSKFEQESKRFKSIRDNIVNYDKTLLSNMRKAVEYCQTMKGSLEFYQLDADDKDAFYHNLYSIVRALHIAKFQDHDMNFENLGILIRYCEWQELFEKLVKLIVSFSIEDPLNKVLMGTIDCLFDHKSKIYEHFKDSRPKRSIFNENKKDVWRQCLKPGEKVDAVLIGKNGSKQWAPANISSVCNDIITLEFVGAPESYDRCYYRFSPYFCPPGTHSSCYEWKQHLQKMDKVCKIDESGILKILTVIHREPKQEKGRNVERVKLGYRIYDSIKWTHQDENGTFCGKDSSFDEDFPLMSTRITRKLNTDDTNQLQNTDSETANDIDYSLGPTATNDMISKYVFAKPGVRLPYLLTHALNCFEKEKGFGKILKIATDKFGKLDFFDRHNCIKWTDKFLSLYKPEFLENFVTEIATAIEKAFKLLSKIDPLIDQISDLLCYIKKLIMILDKVDPEKQEEIKDERLYIKISSTFFESQNINLGNNEWLDCIKFLDPSEHPERKYQSVVYKDCLSKYELLCDIFNSLKQSLSINKRRKDFLIFMLTNNLIGKDNLELFDRVLQSMKNISYNLSTDFSQEIQSISQDQKEAFFQYFEEVEFKSYSILHLHLYCELVQYGFSDSKSCEHKIEFFWNFIVKDNFDTKEFYRWAYFEENTKWVFTHFAKLLKCREDLAKSYRSKCIELLKSENPNANLVCILRHIFKMLLKKSELLNKEEEKDQKKQKIGKKPAKTTIVSDLVDDLIENNNLIKLVYNSLSHHIEVPIDYSTSSTGISLMRHISDEKNVHCMHIKNHLNFLKFIAKYSTFKFTEDKFNEICNIILDIPEFMEHKEVLYQWLVKLSKAQKNECTIFDGFDVEDFMDELQKA